MAVYPDIRFKKNGEKYDWFELTEDCVYESSSFSLVIPKGYITDLGSVPRWLWSVFPPQGRMANASIVHDFMYDTRAGQDVYGENLARLLADTDFAINCAYEGMPTWQVIVMLVFIRLFGRKWWRN